MKPAIRVWHFKDAPKSLRNLSTHGGDEDWIAVIPKGVTTPVSLSWAYQTQHPSGSADVQVVNLEDGRQILIGAHA